MAKKNYKIRAKFVFDGYAIVRASTRQEAEAIAAKSMVAHLGEVETLDEGVADWHFSLKGNTIVNRKREEDGV